MECAWAGVGGFDHSLMLAPDGCLDIVWNGATLTASLPRAHGTRRQVRSSSRNVGVRIACGWAGALVGPDLANAPAPEIDLALLWGAMGRAASARLATTFELRGQRRLLEEFVGEVLADRAPPSGAVLEFVRLLRQDPSLPLKALSTRLGAPERTLRRQVTAATGLSPKELQRVLRFQAIRSRLQADAPVQGAAALAAELGFADQAHMIRECRAMTGRTPAQLQRARPSGRILQDAPRAAD